MKPSLAERQAALLRQNAEVNERVEAIEQSHLLRSVASSGSRSALLNIPPPAVEAKETEDDGSIATDSATTNSRLIARGALAMDLSASIDSFSSIEQPQDADDDANDRKSASATSSAASKPRSSRAMPQAKRSESKGTQQDDSPAKDKSEGDGNDDEETLVPEGLGVDATVRYQKARLRVLQDQVDSSAAHIAQMVGSAVWFWPQC